MKSKNLFAILTLACFMFMMPAAVFATTEEIAASVEPVVVTTVDEFKAAVTTSSAIQLGADITLNEMIKIEKEITIDGNNKKVTSTAAKAFEVYKDAIFKNITIINTKSAGRCVDTRTNVKLKLDNVVLEAKGTSSQPLTIGGFSHGANVTITNSTIDAGLSGYGIISFVETTLDIKKSSISGYAALYFTAGSKDSKITVSENSILNSKNEHDGKSNAFGTIVLADDKITVDIDKLDTLVNAVSDSNQVQSAILLVSRDARIWGVNVTIGAIENITIEGETPSPLVYAGRDGNYDNELAGNVGDALNTVIISTQLNITSDSKAAFLENINVGKGTITWTSDDEDVATVDENGIVTGVAEGTATITASIASGTATINVTRNVKVSDVDVENITLNKSNTSIEYGYSETLTATVTPDNATDKTVTWTSSNTSVATVDENGKVTAVGVGTATITVTTVDGGFTDTCEVTVKAEHTVKFHAVENVTIEKVLTGDKVTKPVDPTAAEGYEFVGWYHEETEYDFSKPVTKDLNLYAKFVKVHTVTFDSNGGSVVALQCVQNGKVVSEPVVPTRSGYTFVGWYHGETKFDFSEPVTSDLTLKAKWDYIPVYVPSYDYTDMPSSPSTSDKSDSSATVETITPSGDTVKVETETKADGTTVEITTTTTNAGETTTVEKTTGSTATGGTVETTVITDAKGEITTVEKTTETNNEGTKVETTITTDSNGETSTSVTATLDTGSAVTNEDAAVTVEVTKVAEAVVEQVQAALAADEAATVVGSADNAVRVSAANTATGVAQSSFAQPMSVSMPVDNTVLSNVTDTSKLTMAKVVTNQDGSTELIYMGGSYNKETGTFNAKIDEDGDYILVEKADLVKIELNIDKTDVKHNDQANTLDVAPKINSEDGSTELPLRYLGEALGFGIEWNNNTVTITKDGNSFDVTIGEEMPGFGKPYVENGRTMISARYISEMMGANVIWDPAARQVVVVK